MQKKRVIIYISIISMIVIIVGLCLVFSFRKRVTFEQYEKYRLDVSIDAKRDGKIESILLGITCDGENYKINSSDIAKDAYIVGKRLYYLDGDTFYWYDVKKSYADIYAEINEFDKVDKTSEIESTKKYTTVLSAKKTNDILSALFFQKKVSAPIKADLITVDGKVNRFSTTLIDLEGYDEVNIEITVDELESNYKVNTSRIFGGGGRIYKVTEANKNIFEIMN